MSHAKITALYSGVANRRFKSLFGIYLATLWWYGENNDCSVMNCDSFAKKGTGTSKKGTKTLKKGTEVGLRNKKGGLDFS